MRRGADAATYYHVIARDTDLNGVPRCIRCSATADDVHEIYPRSHYGPSKEDILFNIKNRCCLCRKCHGEVHNDRGRAELFSILQKRHKYIYDGEVMCLLEGCQTEGQL